MGIQPSIDILTKLKFVMIDQDGDRQAYMHSEGFNNNDVEIVQARIYLNAAGTYSVDLDGTFCAPVVDNEEAFVVWLDDNFPGWSLQPHMKAHA